MHFEIREVNPRRAWRLLVSLDKRIFHAADRFDRNDWRDYECYIVFRDRKPIGSIAVCPGSTIAWNRDAFTRAPHTMFVGSIGIIPSLQRRGIGALLMQWLLGEAKARGFRRVTSNIRPSNVASRRLHRRFGFKKIYRISSFYEDPEEPTDVLECAL